MIRVAGRAEGLISFILTIMGLSDQTHFELFEDRIFYRSNSLSLQIVNTVMLDHVNYTICTLYQPIWILIIGGLLLIASFFHYLQLRLLVLCLPLFWAFSQCSLLTFLDQSFSSDGDQD